jgi:hypothetical protein
MPVDAIEAGTAPGEGLAHLAGPGAQVRQALAAHFVRAIPNVVEIGGFLNPISDHLLNDAACVWVVDPKIAPRTWISAGGCEIRHIAAKHQAVDFRDLPRPYALVMLGCSMKPYGRHAAVDPGLLSLVDGARRLVVEWADALDRATAQVPDLIARPGFETVCRIAWRIEDGVIDRTPFADRTLVVRDRTAGG